MILLQHLMGRTLAWHGLRQTSTANPLVKQAMIGCRLRSRGQCLHELLAHTPLHRHGLRRHGRQCGVMLKVLGTRKLARCSPHDFQARQ